MARPSAKEMLHEIGEALKQEAKYGLSDIRQTHEKLWFGKAQTPSHWQDNLSNNQNPNERSFENLYGKADAPSKHAPTQQPDPMNGIGKAGDEHSNWEAAKQAAQSYHQKNDYERSPIHPQAHEALDQQQSAFDRYYGENPVPDPKTFDDQRLGQTDFAQNYDSGIWGPSQSDSLQSEPDELEPQVSRNGRPTDTPQSFGQTSQTVEVSMEDLYGTHEFSTFTREDLYGHEDIQGEGYDQSYQQARFEDLYGQPSDEQLDIEHARLQEQDQSIDR